MPNVAAPATRGSITRPEFENFSGGLMLRRDGASAAGRRRPPQQLDTYEHRAAADTPSFHGSAHVSIGDDEAFQRPRAATAILATLSRIAHACGFADHRYVCRAFRRAAGRSPSRLRAS